MNDDAAAALRGADVLVVEDDPASAKLLERILRGAGCRVHVARSAKTAGELVLAGLVPALVILDLDLPDLTGMDLARILRSMPGTRDVPIIAVSASGLGFGEAAARAAGCDGFVRKPIAVTTFPQTVAAYLRR